MQCKGKSGCCIRGKRAAIVWRYLAFLPLYTVFPCYHSTGCEAYSLTTDRYVGACRTHEGGSGTKKSAQELTRQGIEPRVLGFEFRLSNHWASSPACETWRFQLRLVFLQVLVPRTSRCTTMKLSGLLLLCLVGLVVSQVFFFLLSANVITRNVYKCFQSQHHGHRHEHEYCMQSISLSSCQVWMPYIAILKAGGGTHDFDILKLNKIEVLICFGPLNYKPHDQPLKCIPHATVDDKWPNYIKTVENNNQNCSWHLCP